MTMPSFQNDDWFYSEVPKDFATFLSVSKCETFSTHLVDYYSFDSTPGCFGASV